MRPEVGQIIVGKYRLTRLIGEGGMGSVFEANHEYLGSAVALKFLNPILASRPALVARFLQEARVSASIRSPHVVQVSDVDQTLEGLPYLVMELLEGESLQTCMNRCRTLPLGTALEYAVQILNGLESAHGRGVVHRDLKPDNVFIVPTPHGALLKLLDFGIAKLRSIADEQPGLTRPGSVMGTLEYMAPEQALSADRADLRADLYSVGVILFEMIAGVRPLEADDPQTMAAQVMAGQIRRLNDIVSGIPQPLSDTIARALAGQPAQRFQSAAEMRTALLPFFTASVQAVGMPHYQSMVALPAAAPARSPTAVLADPAISASDRPAPTQPGTDPGQPAGVSPTLPPSESAELVAGRTGTVLGDAAGAFPEGFGATAQMQPMEQPPFVPSLAPAPIKKKKLPMGLILGGVAGLLGLLVTIAFIAYFYVIRQEPEVPAITLPPVATIAQEDPSPDPSPTNEPTIVPPVTTAEPPSTTPTGTTTVRPRDAGVDAGFVFPTFPDVGIALPPFPSSIPSGLIPPLPTELPTIPLPPWPPSNP